jgi:hypothetical protein
LAGCNGTVRGTGIYITSDAHHAVLDKLERIARPFDPAALWPKGVTIRDLKSAHPVRAHRY